MQTGYNGCVWVCMGALGCRGHGAHKNKASRGYLGPKRAGFGFYGRVFLAIRPKVIQMHADGYYVVCMGANRRIRKGESKNRAKRAQNE